MFLPEILPAVEIGWPLDPDCWGQGLAAEGARDALREEFDILGLDEIVCILEAANTRLISRPPPPPLPRRSRDLLPTTRR